MAIPESLLVEAQTNELVAYWLFGSQGVPGIEPLDLGPGDLLILGVAGGLRRAATRTVFNAQQRALLELSNEALRKGVTREEAGILTKWATEYEVSWHGPEIHRLRPNANFWHLHIGPVKYIPVSGCK